MMKVGLTGNRFSGKTTISKLFKTIGIPVFEADIILKFIIHSDLYTISEIKSRVGEHIFTNGHIDSKKVTDHEFETILQCSKHSLMKAYDAFNNKKPGFVYTIFNSSFLFETEFSAEMDYNITVFCPKIHRMERIKESTSMKVSDISFMLRGEMDDLDKNRLSQYVIHNYENMDILTQVNNLDKKIVDNYLKIDNMKTNLQLTF